MAEQTTSQNGLAGAISSAIAPVLSQAQTGLVEDVNDTFGGEGSIAPTPAPTPSAPAAPSLTTPQPTVQPGFRPNMPIVPSRGGLGNSQTLLTRLLMNQEDMRDQISAMNRFGQSPFATPVTLPTSPNFAPPATGLATSYKNVFASEDPTERMRNAGFSAGGKTEAKAVQNQGRGNDTMLVHMTPGEVAGLQALAMQHGGSLTINPETGLAEAGFLKSILPTLIGAGLVIGTGGTISPLMAGFGVGGFEALRTGDLGKGIMAGLGAYGGGGIGAGLTAAGAAGSGSATTGMYGEKGVMAVGAPPPTTIAGRFAQAGTGLTNLGTEAGREAFIGTAADAATGAEATGLGGGIGATKAAMATLSSVTPLETAPMPTVTQPEYDYKGPYMPTKREVVYPGEDRDPNDSSEFLYFPNTNPYPGFEPASTATSVTDLTGEPQFAGVPVSLATNPARMREYQENPSLYRFAEGGTSVATAPPEGYVPGQDGEFVYGFTPMSTDMPVVQETARASRGIGAIAPAPDTIRIASTRVSGGDGGDNTTGPGVSFNTGRPNDYEAEAYNVGMPTREEKQQDRAAAAREAALMAKGGEVNMHNNGFVVDAHTVSEIGNGSSNAGMERFMAIGGRPIMGPGDGTSDSIPANIDGMQPAMVARDEVYMPPPAVAAYGGGSLKVGEKKLYKLMEKAHASRKKNGRGQSTGLKQLVS